MKRPFLFFLLFGTIILSGCTKDNNDDNDPVPPAPDKCRVMKFSRLNFADHLFEYDNLKRLVRNEYSSYITNFSYNGNVVTIEKTSNGNPFYNKIVTLNSNGLAVNIRTENPNNTWYNEAYEYNGTQVVKMSYTTHSNSTPKHTLYQWSDGNLVQVTEPDGDITTYTYYPTKLPQAGDYQGKGDLELGYKIVKTKNRLKSILSSSGTLFTIGYTEDSDGKIKEYSVDISGANGYHVDVSYECD